MSVDFFIIDADDIQYDRNKEAFYIKIPIATASKKHFESLKKGLDKKNVTMFIRYPYFTLFGHPVEFMNAQNIAVRETRGKVKVGLIRRFVKWIFKL